MRRVVCGPSSVNGWLGVGLSPWSRRLLSDFASLVPDAAAGGATAGRHAGPPRFNIDAVPNGWQLTTELPGWSSEQLEIDVQSQVLFVRGNNPDSKGSVLPQFERQFRLPFALTNDAVDATFERGVLTIIARAPAAPPAQKVVIRGQSPTPASGDSTGGSSDSV